MIDQIEILKQTLKNGDYTCVISYQNDLYTSKERGVKPLLELLDKGVALCGAYAADKVVGKAAAFIYVKLGIAALYAAVVSEPAYAVLTNAGISVFYDELTDAIKNRRGDGYCPMESAVKEITDTDTAILLLRKLVAAT